MLPLRVEAVVLDDPLEPSFEPEGWAPDAFAPTPAFSPPEAPSDLVSDPFDFEESPPDSPPSDLPPASAVLRLSLR